jgi:hypothetical protein
MTTEEVRRRIDVMVHRGSAWHYVDVTIDVTIAGS